MNYFSTAHKFNFDVPRDFRSIRINEAVLILHIVFAVYGGRSGYEACEAEPLVRKPYSLRQIVAA